MHANRAAATISRRGGRPAVTIEYTGQLLPNALVIDLLVEGKVIVELKAVQEIHPIHSAQVMTYLRLSGLPAALLINFNAATVKHD